MRVLTIRSEEVMSDELKNEIHFAFGMERHTDYVFKDRSGSVYSATINMEATDSVINQIIEQSANFSDQIFIIDDLDLVSNTIERYKVQNGETVEHLNSSWDWK